VAVVIVVAVIAVVVAAIAVIVVIVNAVVRIGVRSDRGAALANDRADELDAWARGGSADAGLEGSFDARPAGAAIIGAPPMRPTAKPPITRGSASPAAAGSSSPTPRAGAGSAAQDDASDRRRRQLELEEK
jgi:hypothetical protein